MFEARLKEPEVSYDTGRPIARLEITGGYYREWYSAQQGDKEYSVKITVSRNPRSLDANSYYHVLVGKIADAMSVSKPEVKNMTLSRYGQIEIVNGKPIYLIVPDDQEVEKWEELHLRATSQIKELNGVVYRVYMKVRGSHTYDSKEMSVLIDGTISEAIDAGLTEAEIMSTREKKILKEVYGID